MPPSTPGAPPPPPSRDLSIAESAQRAQAIAASLARSKGALGAPQQGGSQGPLPPAAPPAATTPSPGQHGFTPHRPSASGQRGPPPHPPPPFEHAVGGPHDSGFSQGPAARGTPSFDHGSTDKQQQSQYMQTPGRSEASWSSVDAAAAIAAQQKQVRSCRCSSGSSDSSRCSSSSKSTKCKHHQQPMMQQRARRAALRAMETVCAAIPKPDIKETDLLGEIKKTAVSPNPAAAAAAAAAVVAAGLAAAATAAAVFRQLENGVWVLDFPLQSGVCAATAASPDAWQQLQRQDLIASLRKRTGAGFVLRGCHHLHHQQQQQQQQGVYLRVASEDQETVFKGVVAAWSVVGARQHLPAPVDAADDETFDCACAMAGEEDEFLKDVFRRTGVFVELEHEPPQGGDGESRPIAAVAIGLHRRGVETTQRTRIHARLISSSAQDSRGSAVSSFWHSAMPDEAEMMRRRREAEERRKKRGQQRSRSASPERRGPPNKLSFAPPPDELLTGPYAPLDK
ncbi:hypothetical protein ACSSS7_005313 [Eimeria intestinalis]